jgi:hypothetical protein
MGNFGVVSYDDLQVSISGVRIPPANAPTWRDWNFGIGGGVLFPVLGFDVGDLFYFYIQTTHATKLSTTLDYHVHWSVPNNNAGRFRFRLDVIGAPVMGTFATLASSPFTAEKILSGADSGVHNLFDIADLNAINTTVSTVFICKLERIAATTAEYASEVYVFFNDCHVQQDSAGSVSEIIK